MRYHRPVPVPKEASKSSPRCWTFNSHNNHSPNAHYGESGERDHPFHLGCDGELHRTAIFTTIFRRYPPQNPRHQAFATYQAHVTPQKTLGDEKTESPRGPSSMTGVGASKSRAQFRSRQRGLWSFIGQRAFPACQDLAVAGSLASILLLTPMKDSSNTNTPVIGLME